MEIYRKNSPILIGIVHSFATILMFVSLFVLMTSIASTLMGILFALLELPMYILISFISGVSSLRMSNRLMDPKIQMCAKPNAVFISSTLTFVIFGIAVITLYSMAVYAGIATITIALGSLLVISLLYYFFSSN